MVMSWTPTMHTWSIIGHNSRLFSRTTKATRIWWGYIRSLSSLSFLIWYLLSYSLLACFLDHMFSFNSYYFKTFNLRLLSRSNVLFSSTSLVGFHLDDFHISLHSWSHSHFRSHSYSCCFCSLVSALWKTIKEVSPNNVSIFSSTKNYLLWIIMNVLLLLTLNRLIYKSWKMNRFRRLCLL